MMDAYQQYIHKSVRSVHTGRTTPGDMGRDREPLLGLLGFKG